MAKSGRLELGDNIYGQYRSIFNHCDVFGQQRNGNRRKTQNKGYYAVQGHPRSSKVIEVGTNRKPVCNFLWHPISYRFGDIAAYCSNFGHFAFLSHPLGALGTTYDVHFGLIGKRVVDFLLVIINLFSLGVTAEVLGATIDRKSAILRQSGHFDPKFQVEGDVPTNIFCMNS